MAAPRSGSARVPVLATLMPARPPGGAHDPPPRAVVGPHRGGLIVEGRTIALQFLGLEIGGGRECPAPQAEAAYKADAGQATRVMAIDHRNFEHVPLGVGDDVSI